MALVRLKKRGGSRKGKLEPAERERVEEFIARVKTGELNVTKGELAKAMRLYVCSGMERSQEFFEKLVSRRGLNKTMKHLLLPRRKREDDASSEHSGGGTKRQRNGTATTPNSVLSGMGYAATRESAKRTSRSPAPDALSGGGDMGGFMGGYSNQSFNYGGQGNVFSSPLHPDALSFGGGSGMGMGGLGGHELGIGGPGMGMMSVSHSSGMHSGAGNGMHAALPGLSVPGMASPPSFHLPGGGSMAPNVHAGGMGHSGHMHPSGAVVPPVRSGGATRSASEAAAAASAALASSLGLGAPLSKHGGGTRAPAVSTVASSQPGNTMPPPARAPVMQSTGAGAAQEAPPSGKGMRRDWSLESLERLADVASIESSEIDALHQMLEQRQGGGGARV